MSPQNFTTTLRRTSLQALPWEFLETSKTISTAVSLGEFIDQLLLKVISLQEKSAGRLIFLRNKESKFSYRIFPNNESFIFYCNNSKSFESVFCMKTVRSRIFKKHLKKRKSRAQFCLSFGWLRTRFFFIRKSFFLPEPQFS